MEDQNYDFFRFIVKIIINEESLQEIKKKISDDNGMKIVNIFIWLV